VVIHPADGLIHRLLRQSGQPGAASEQASQQPARRDQVNISDDARARLQQGGGAEVNVDRLGEQLLLQTYKRGGRRG